jgi:hypothetical protein
MARGARGLGPLGAGALAYVGAWSALEFLPVFGNWLLGDIPLYRAWGAATAAGQLPYRDFSFDYPPGAIPPFVGPVYLRKLAGYHGSYDGWFRFELLVLGLLAVASVAWALRSLDASRIRSYAALVFVGLATLLLGPVALSHFDIWPAFVTALGVALLLAGRERLACATLAAGFAVKVYPVLLLPVALIALRRRRGRRGVLEGIGISVAVAAVCFVPFALAAPHGLWHALWREERRPLQVESLAASLWLLAHRAGLHLGLVTSYGSDNIVTHGAHVAATLSEVVVAVAVVAIWAGFARGRGGREEIALACAACVAVDIAFGKVFSPQYLVWLLPLVPLVGGRRGLWASGTLAVAAGLTQIWEPYRYGDLQRLAGLESSLVFVRDLVVVALAAMLAWPAARARA